MAIIILGGVAQGFKIKVLEHKELRPTSVLLRRKVFDAHQDLLEFTFIDLCAGTGAMGLEAWSRGASTVYLIEKNKLVFKNLEHTVKEFSKRYFPFEEKAREMKVTLDDAVSWTVKFKLAYSNKSPIEQQQTIFFLDPPYKEWDVYQKIIDLFTIEKWFKGQLWIESERSTPIIEEKIAAFDLKITKSYHHGDRTINVIRFS